MKYIAIIFSLFIGNPVFADLTKTDIIPKMGTSDGVNQVVTASVDKAEGLTSIFTYARDSIFKLLALVAIGVFLFIGAKLVVARGNPEEFKKALNMFIYAIVGLFVVSVAYAAVRMVAGLNF